MTCLTLSTVGAATIAQNTSIPWCHGAMFTSIWKNSRWLPKWYFQLLLMTHTQAWMRRANQRTGCLLWQKISEETLNAVNFGKPVHVGSAISPPQAHGWGKAIYYCNLCPASRNRSHSRRSFKMDGVTNHIKAKWIAVSEIVLYCSVYLSSQSLDIISKNHSSNEISGLRFEQKSLVMLWLILELWSYFDWQLAAASSKLATAVPSVGC